jgi:hypothetical protein
MAGDSFIAIGFTPKACTRAVPWGITIDYSPLQATRWLYDDPLFPGGDLERGWAIGPIVSPHPSFETFHFTKSHPAYLAEMLGRLGWRTSRRSWPG